MNTDSIQLKDAKPRRIEPQIDADERWFEKAAGPTDDSPGQRPGFTFHNVPSPERAKPVLVDNPANPLREAFQAAIQSGRRSRARLNPSPGNRTPALWGNCQDAHCPNSAV